MCACQTAELRYRAASHDLWLQFNEQFAGAVAQSQNTEWLQAAVLSPNGKSDKMYSKQQECAL